MGKVNKNNMANLKYQGSISEVEKELKTLREKLDAHKELQQENKNDYGFPSDTEFVLNRLQEINQFLS